jgi:hypothetical protein
VPPLRLTILRRPSFLSDDMLQAAVRPILSSFTVTDLSVTMTGPWSSCSACWRRESGRVLEHGDRLRFRATSATPSTRLSYHPPRPAPRGGQRLARTGAPRGQHLPAERPRRRRAVGWVPGPGGRGEIPDGGGAAGAGGRAGRRRSGRDRLLAEQAGEPDEPGPGREVCRALLDATTIPRPRVRPDLPGFTLMASGRPQSRRTGTAASPLLTGTERSGAAGPASRGCGSATRWARPPRRGWAYRAGTT